MSPVGHPVAGSRSAMPAIPSEPAINAIYNECRKFKHQFNLFLIHFVVFFITECNFHTAARERGNNQDSYERK